eukprot:CAMPEP_0170068126 /NCGR_PEP_ID=MMETSP0019_2-20121128/7206_1 /TAXON_ID=98059 /ORGANISM="Dinobryon sp., Strain UTEXLB2267" /LENGTH=209 /DNA_ID=CAMNT_0010275669 /DNA_START=1124 /DNA_END=1753 /DNA_ORIENTATION=-
MPFVSCMLVQHVCRFIRSMHVNAHIHRGVDFWGHETLLLIFSRFVVVLVGDGRQHHQPEQAEGHYQLRTPHYEHSGVEVAAEACVDDPQKIILDVGAGELAVQRSDALSHVGQGGLHQAGGLSTGSGVYAVLGQSEIECVDGCPAVRDVVAHGVGARAAGVVLQQQHRGVVEFDGKPNVASVGGDAVGGVVTVAQRPSQLHQHSPHHAN